MSSRRSRCTSATRAVHRRLRFFNGSRYFDSHDSGSFRFSAGSQLNASGSTCQAGPSRPGNAVVPVQFIEDRFGESVFLRITLTGLQGELPGAYSYSADGRKASFFFFFFFFFRIGMLVGRNYVCAAEILFSSSFQEHVPAIASSASR